MCSAVPFRGSIIGTRRRGSVPMSKTRESQLAVTTASGHRARHLPRNQARVPGGGSLTASAACVGRDQAAQAEAQVDRLVRPQVVVLQGQGGHPGVAPAAAVPVLVGQQDLLLGHPVQGVGQGGRVRLEAPEDGLPVLEDQGTDLARRHPGRSGRAPRRTCGPPRRAPTAFRGRWRWCRRSATAAGPARGRPRPGAGRAPGRPG